MPLFSEHISNMYYSGTPSYSAPSYSYSAPSGTSYSASYLNPGSLYSKHSSIGGYSRAPITPRWTPSVGRTYNPILSTISERSTSSPVRIGSPRRVHIPKRTYALSSYTPRPININTADIDVSRDKYRPPSSPASLSAAARPRAAALEAPLQSSAPIVPIDTPVVDNGPFMPRVDGKPETGIDSSPGNHHKSTIKRGRTVVRLHTVKRKERDSPRKPVDDKADDTQMASASDGTQQEPETSQGWREKLSEDLVYKDKREKKTLGAKLVEKFILKDKEEDEDFTNVRKDLLKKKDDETEGVVESLPPPPAKNVVTTSKSPDRRCSMELLVEQANVLDSLIRRENLSLATLDLTKIGVDEGTKYQNPKLLSIKRRKSNKEENPLQTTKSDHSIHDRMKSLRDSREKKKRSLKKSASGGSLRRLDSITEFPRELSLMPLPVIQETRHSIKYGSIKDKPESVNGEISEHIKTEEVEEKDKPFIEEMETFSSLSTKLEEVKNSPKSQENPKPVKIVEMKGTPGEIFVDTPKSRFTKNEKENDKAKPPNLKAKITSTVDISPPKSPIKFVVDNVIVEENISAPKKGFTYSSNIDEETKIILGSILKTEKNEEDELLKPETRDSVIDAPSPEPDDGNFWSKIGKRETVYLKKRKQNIEETLEKDRRAQYWFPEEEEEQQQDSFADRVKDSIRSGSKIEIALPFTNQPKDVPRIVDTIGPEIEKQEVDTKMKIKSALNVKPIEVKKNKPRMEVNVDPNVEIHQTIQNVEITLKGPNRVQVMPTPATDIDDAKITTPVLVSKIDALKNQSPMPPIKQEIVVEKVLPNVSGKVNESPHTSGLHENNSTDHNGTKNEALKNYNSRHIKASSAQDLKINSAEPLVASFLENSIESLAKPLNKIISSDTFVQKSPEASLKDAAAINTSVCPSSQNRVEEDKTKPQVSKLARPGTKPKTVEKVPKKVEKSPTGTCTECKKPLLKSTPPKQVPVPKPESKEVVRRATASVKTKDLDVRRFTDEKPLQTAEVRSTPVVEQSKKGDIPKTQNEITTESTGSTQEAPAGEGNKAELLPATTGNAQIEINVVPPKLTPKKPVKVEAALRPLIATPRPLQKKAPQIIQSSSSSESSSEESSDEDESGSSEGSGEFFECENNPDGRTSTGSNDSGFDSSAPTSPAGFVHIKKDCDVNCHRKCEKLTANLCGVNQRLLVEALASKTASRRGAETPGTSASAAPSAETAPDVLLDELESSTAYSLFRETGRFTPPARSIPRFRKYNIEDFHFIKVLGKGSFGKVLLTELRDTEYYYAVKCLKKDVVLEDDDVECTLIERKVLALGTNHPYLCHLFATFQTDSHLFFVMEYLNGGDLMFHIQQSGRFPESRARFYAAEIVSGLKFLHKRGIVYRDLKLDNILLDYEGHVRIADFGMCKLQIFLDKTADTFCGTPDYMAPEIIKGLKYNQTVDWWSFGVLLYEMLIGQSPFSGCDEDELFWSICNEMPSYPRFLSQEALTILTRLLDKDARTRLGGMDCMHGDVRDQEFFHSINWDRLDRRELETPFKPRVRHPLDTQYFDRAFTGERPRLTAVEPQVLRSMDQEPFRGFSYTNPNATDR